MNTIYLIGDSTCHKNSKKTYPQLGWGQVFSMYVNNNYKVVNLAENGRSSKSFLEEGLFTKCEEISKLHKRQNHQESEMVFKMGNGQ